MKIIGLGNNNRIGQSGSILGRFKSGPLVAPVVSGSLFNQLTQQGTGVVTYTTSGAFTGVVASWSMTGAAAGITISASTGVVSVDRAVVSVNVFNLVIRATNAAGFAETGFSLTVTSAAAGLSYGFDPNLDLGTAGNYFVDALAGSNANPGTSFGSAKQTIAAAMALATAGQTVRVIGNGVSYREILFMKSGVAVRGYGTHKPILNAGAPLTGWVQCTGADAAVLGSVTPANVWKRTGLLKSNIASGSAFALNLIEAGNKMPLARTWGRKSNKPQFYDEPDDWIKSQSTNTEAVTSPTVETQIRSWVLPAAYSSLTSAQVMQCGIRLISEPNANRVSAPLSYVQGTRTLTPVTQNFEYENNNYKDTITLINIIPLMQVGEYGFVDNGSTVDVYCWPSNVSNLTSSIEYAQEVKCVDIGTTSNCTLEGFVIANASSASTNPADGGHAITGNSISQRSNVTLNNLKIQNTERYSTGYGVFDIKGVNNLRITNCEVNNAVGQFGMFLRGTTGNSPTTSNPAENLNVGQGWAPFTGGLIERNFIRLTESGPFRIYSAGDLAIVRNVCEFNGMSTHSNKISIYEQAHNVLLLFNRFRGANGYITWQESSDLVFVGNDLVVSYNSDDSGNIGRGFEDQNGSNNLKPCPARFDAPYRPVVRGSFALNNRVAPYDLFGPSEDRSFNIGSTETTVFWTAYNNLINGSANSITPQITAFDRNFYTNGTALAGFDLNSQFSTSSATYVDPSNGNLAIAAGSAVRSMTSQNLSSIMASMEIRFPQVSDWVGDIAGNSMDWATPTIGPFASYNNAGTFAAQRIRWPEITGAGIPGQVLQADTGWVEVDPFPGQSIQWQRTLTPLNDASWVNISGATASTYTVQAGDAGYTPRISVTTGTDIAFSQGASAIIATYPISDPTVLVATGDTTAGTEYQTSTFTATNRPILVMVFQSLVAAAAANQSVTIGAPGRSFGTGTAIAQSTLGIRSSTQMTSHFIAAPGSGSVTVQTTSSAASSACRIVVLEIQGAASVGAFASIGASTTTRTPSVTTISANSIVLYAGYKANATGDALSVVNATLLDAGNTGGTSSSDAVCLVAWELAPSVSTYDCTINSINSAAFGAAAIEVRS